MKYFLKVFVASVVIFSLVVGVGFVSYGKLFDPIELTLENLENNENNSENENNSPFDQAGKISKRINVLLVGLEGTRTDTIMFASYDRKNKTADIISIPRDTYYPRDGYGKYSEFMKINAIYGSEKIEGLMDAVEDLLGIPIDNYVSIEYDGVRKAVDAVGGVEMDIPFHMKYDDPYDDPPLHINIPAGKQIIHGDKAVEFLRFRKGNYGYQSYPEGDVGRVKMQQEFLKAAIGKALGLKLPNVITEVYPYVKTNFSLNELLGLAGDAIGFSTSDITTRILPGEGQYMGNLSFFIVDEEETLKLAYDIYGVKVPGQEDEDDSSDDTIDKVDKKENSKPSGQ